MSDAVKINTIEVENTKRIRAASAHLTENGLTVIGGGNRAGKTSFLDAIAWLLGGEKFRPTEPHNTAGGRARIRGELSNGLVVERKGKNGTLTVTDPSGAKSGQGILSEIIPVLALDLPSFVDASDKQKAKILLSILGVEEELQKLEEAEKALYADREALGREAKRASAYADELPMYEDAPAAILSAQELIQAQQAVLLKNAENAKARKSRPEIEREIVALVSRKKEALAAIADRERRIIELQNEIKVKRQECADIDVKGETLKTRLEAAAKTEAELKDGSTAELEAQLADIEAANAKVRANQEKAKARLKAEGLEHEYKEMGTAIAEIRNQITALLEGAELPLPELTVVGGELVYRGQRWDCMSGSEQLKVATAIVRKLNPACGFVLVDKLEQMDLQTLREFAAWAESEGLQIIGTRVSTGAECSLIIEDGNLIEAEAAEEATATSIEEDPNLCPVDGKYYGQPWATIPRDVLGFALDNQDQVPEITPAHVASIKQALND